MSGTDRTDTDVVVAGGGLAGLAAAAYVARSGLTVMLLERSSHTGGRAMTQDQGGYKFNLGPHALYKGGNGVAVLRELGVQIDGGIPPVGGHALRDGGLHILPATPWAMLRTGLLNTGAKFEMGRIFAGINRIDTAAIAGISLADWLANNVSRSEVRQVLASFARLATYSSDPAHVSAGMVIGQLQMAVKGVYYLHGGWQTLVDGLAARATEAGARIETGASVTAVERNGEAYVVRLDSSRSIRAGSVVVAASPRVAAELTGDAELRTYAGAAEPVRAATLDVGLRSLPRPKARFVLGVDTPLYLSVHSGVADLAPPDGAMIHVAKYAGREKQDAAEIERELEAVLELAQPGWRDVLAERRFLPNLTVVEALATATGGGLPGRPGPALPASPGLYVAGDWVSQEGWLADAALTSAKRAAAAIITSSGGESRAANGAVTAATATVAGAGAAADAV